MEPRESNDEPGESAALYAAEWEMRKAVGVLSDRAAPTHQRAAKLLVQWRDLRIEAREND